MSTSKSVTRLSRLWTFAKRVSDEADADDADIVAAGLAFYGLLGLFPALLAMVSLYGLIADPADIHKFTDSITRALPERGRVLLNQELADFVARSSRNLSWHVVMGFVAVLWSSSSAMGVLVRAINVAYDIPERHSFFQRRKVAVLFTLAGVVGVVVLIPLITILPKVLDFFQFGVGVSLLRWPMLGSGAVVALMALYRYALQRDRPPSFRSTLPGALLAAVGWVVLCIAYSAYVQDLTSFSSTYGAVEGVIVLEFWLYMSSLILVYGAEVNAELERVAQSPDAQRPRRGPV
jgi:membrane protein